MAKNIAPNILEKNSLAPSPYPRRAGISYGATGRAGFNVDAKRKIYAPGLNGSNEDSLNQGSAGHFIVRMYGDVVGVYPTLPRRGLTA